MRLEYGFIGAGNMSTALVKALIEQVPGNAIGISNRTSVKAKDLTRSTGTIFFESNEEIVKNSKIVVLGVKPQNLPELFKEIEKPILERLKTEEDSLTFVTMAAGVTTEKICKMVKNEIPVIRIMPNTPSAISEGTILISKNDLVDDFTFERFIKDFSGAGTFVKMNENSIDAASTISGCGPAYIYMYMEAMAKAGISLGLDPEIATELAVATTRGTSGLALASEESLSDLRNAVCSPGGTTIEGVKSLEESNINLIVKKALEAAYNRTLELAKE